MEYHRKIHGSTLLKYLNNPKFCGVHLSVRSQLSFDYLHKSIYYKLTLYREGTHHVP